MVIFSSDGKKFFVNSIEGMETVIFDSDSAEESGTIHHYSDKDAPLFQNHARVFDAIYLTLPKQGTTNCFSGKPVEFALSHNGKYFRFFTYILKILFLFIKNYYLSRTHDSVSDKGPSKHLQDNAQNHKWRTGMRMLFTFLLTFAPLVLLAIPVFAAEEIAPGFNECNAQTETLGQENVCLGRAVTYWANKLEHQYKKICEGCKSAPRPEECAARLKKMQRGWLVYTDLIADFLKSGLLRAQEHPYTSSINESLEFEAWATHRQYEILKMLEDR